MANEELVAAVKTIVSLAKAGKTDDAYAGYAKLFSDAAFAKYTPQEQRQALRLMILAKGMPPMPPASVVDAHKRAIKPVQALVNADGEPADYELLGICQMIAGDEKAARASFQAGLDLERQRDPQSDLCGTLMKRVASV
jgi:hypothetical protein